MGNASGKEERRPSPTFPRTLSGSRSASSSGAPPNAFNAYGPDGGFLADPRTRQRDLAQLLGAPGGSGSGDRDAAGLERRRETRAEREAKRLERERVNRERERERSMREESVDGGYLVTQGVYTGIEDFSKPMVRQLMIERRLAPFWRGLNDHSDSWTEAQLVAAARGLPIPAPDEVPNLPLSPAPVKEEETHEKLAEQTMKNLSVPIAARPQPTQNDTLQLSVSSPTQAPISSSPPPSSGSLLRGRAKTLASLTAPSKPMPTAELQPREMHLPHDPNVNGQPIEAYLYKDASECPICFLYYPPYLNRTRCCDQPICSECFVQIKRPDPHPPEHPDPNDPQHANEQAQEQEGQLVSEPSQCPYCAQPEFGVTFDQLPFRRGLTYVNQPGVGQAGSMAMSSSSSLSSNQASGQLSPGGRRRAGSLAVTAPQVISTDRVRPDWATKLAAARAHQARRSAAATALHTAAYLMNGRSGGERVFPGFGRRVMMRRGTGDGQLQPIGMAFPERYIRVGEEESPTENRDDNNSPTMIGPPRGSSRRRVEDLEEMMMMEAIRLSLASEEERRKKEDKEAKKEAKKKAKEDKKAEKNARKAGTGPYASNSAQSANQSTGTLGTPSSASISIDQGSAKGKNIARDERDTDSLYLSRSAPQGSESGSGSDSALSYLDRSRAQLKADAAGSAPYRPSHLRNLSNVSSDVSSLAESTEILSGKGETGRSDGEGGALEPLFNFRSLAAMIGDGENESETGKEEGAAVHAENGGVPPEHGMAPSHEEKSTAEANATAVASSHKQAGQGESDALSQSVSTLTPENIRVATALDGADSNGNVETS